MAEEAQAVFRITIRGSIEAIWKEVTRTDVPLKSFFNSRRHVVADRPGSAMQMRTPSGRYTMVVGEILEWTPPTRYSHTFQFTQYQDPPCVVTYELKPVAGAVEVTLTVDRMPPGTRTAKDMSSGGTMILKTLKAMVETGRPSFGVRIMYAMFELLEFVLPKKCRSEHWPMK